MVEACEAHAIRYFIVGGSLLGAIRHGGFIPWDDDIDVSMPRPDYERFRRIAKAGLPGPLRWVDWETDPAYPFMFGKLLRADTLLLERWTAHLPIPHEIGIDIFPLDGAPTHRLSRLSHKLILKGCRLALGRDLRYSGLKRLGAKVLHLVPRGFVIHLLNGFARRFPYDRVDRVVNAGGAWGYDREAVPRSWFGEGSTLCFEDIPCKGPAEWERYLAHIYGDYHTPPPDEDRKTDHVILKLRLPPLKTNEE